MSTRTPESGSASATAHPLESAPDQAILDAARACVVDIGVKRTTFSEVARRAGVSRMTLYRHFDDLRALLSALMTREFARVVTEAQREAAGRVTSDARAALVEAAVNGARAMSREPLFDRILELDPELLVPYMVERVGESQRAIRAMLADAIAAGHADGSVRQADPAVMAAAVELTARGYVLGARARDDAFADDAALDELRTMLDRYLAP